MVLWPGSEKGLVHLCTSRERENGLTLTLNLTPNLTLILTLTITITLTLKTILARCEIGLDPSATAYNSELILKHPFCP